MPLPLPSLLLVVLLVLLLAEAIAATATSSAAAVAAAVLVEPSSTTSRSSAFSCRCRCCSAGFLAGVGTTKSQRIRGTRATTVQERHPQQIRRPRPRSFYVGSSSDVFATGTALFAPKKEKDDANDRNSDSNNYPVPPPLSVPVWSLAANIGRGEDYVKTKTTSMNIVTFATPLSVSAPKLWIVSLYHDTMTKDCFCDQERWGVLQLLTPDQKLLVEVLGKHSGYDSPEYDKERECSLLGYDWTATELVLDDKSLSIEVLPKCASYVCLRRTIVRPDQKQQLDAGDHLAVLCEVAAVGRWDETRNCVVWNFGGNDESLPALDETTVLYTGRLRQEGII